MTRIRFTRRFVDDDPTSNCLDESTRAVPCSKRYAEIDNEGGAITFMDVRPEDVRPLGEFSPGDEVFVESDDPNDVFDGETDGARRNTHLWWRATVLPASTESAAKYTLDGEPVDFHDFIADNAETFAEDDVAAVHALEVGGEIEYGGAAEPVSVLRRVG